MKVVRHTKKQENMSHSPEKKKNLAIETACESKQMPFKKQRLPSSHYKCAQRTKRNSDQTSKGRHDGNVH